MMAMHLCGVTKNLRIGCGFNVVPMWHPLRLAEATAPFPRESVQRCFQPATNWKRATGS
jgi:hypothetical protein